MLPEIPTDQLFSNHFSTIEKIYEDVISVVSLFVLIKYFGAYFLQSFRVEQGSTGKSI